MPRMQGNNPIRVKKQNETLIKEMIYKYGPISRSQIAEMLSLTPPTITTNVNALIRQGFVRETSQEERQEEKENRQNKESRRPLGRRPVQIDFVADACYVIGAEINKYQIAVCLMDLRGRVIESRRFIPETDEYEPIIQALLSQIEKVVQDSGVEEEKILGAGVGLTGFVDPKTGILKKSAYQNWENNHKVAKDIGRRLNMPVVIENNARMRAIGEEMFGNQDHVDTFAYYLISYGLACPMFINDSVLTGETFGAGEIGHMVVDIHGPKCEVCGDSGCLEEMASERAIVKQIREGIKQGVDTMLNDMVSSPEEIGMREILAAEECGDELACEVVGKAIVYLGMQLANIINFISPPLVIIDGYIMKLKRNRRLILAETKKHLFGIDDQDIEFQFVEFDHFTGARGAGALAIKKYFIEA
ncbi:MAG: ROK family protein [Lachnospiraceae bacterium]